MVQSVIESFQWGLAESPVLMRPSTTKEGGFSDFLSLDDDDDDETALCASSEFGVNEQDDEAAILQTVVALGGCFDPATNNNSSYSRFSQRSRRISRRISVQSNSSACSRRSSGASRSGTSRFGRCISGGDFSISSNSRPTIVRGVSRCASLKYEYNHTTEKIRVPRRVLSSEVMKCCTSVSGHELRSGSLTYSIPTTRLSLRRTSGHHRPTRKSDVAMSA